MKLIIAIIQPYRIDAVREALTEVGVEGLTVSEVRGYGRQRGQKEIYRGAEYSVSYVPKLKLEIAVVAEKADEVVEAITRSARTGKIGDGKQPSVSGPVKWASRRSSGTVRPIARVCHPRCGWGCVYWPSLTHFPIRRATASPWPDRSISPEIGDLT